jgi:hypothetical protein
MTATDDLQETARRLLERDCAEQGVPAVCEDPTMLAAVTALMRPSTLRAAEGGGRDAGP